MTDPIKSLELLVESRGKATQGTWLANKLCWVMSMEDAEFSAYSANFAADDAPRLLAIIRRQRQALDFYADGKHFKSVPDNDGTSDLCVERGYKACAALNDEGETNV